MMVRVNAELAGDGQNNAVRLLVPAARSSFLWRGAADTGGTARLFGISISDTSVAAASRTLIDAARFGKRTRVIFANAHVINEAASRDSFAQVVKSADLVFADGSGMAVAAKLAGTRLADNVNGTDLFPRIAADAAATGVKIFLIGGRPGTAATAAERMRNFGLGDALIGTHHGYFAPGSPEETEAIAAANASGAAIVLVGLGVPLQDEWIAQHGDKLSAPVRIGVGGLFDYFAGNVTRAPHVMRVVGCEWVWRLALEPRRMARRYLIGNFKFMGLALREAIQARRERGALQAAGRSSPSETA